MAEKTNRPPCDGWKELKYSLVLPLLTIAVFLGVWELASRLGLVSASLLPAPSQLARTFAEKLYQTEPDGATLGQSILSSLKTSFSGFLLAVVVGVPLGLFMGFYEPVDRFVKPVFEMIRPIPPIAFIPLTIVMLGIGFKAKMFIVCFAAFVPCVMNSYTGIKLTNPVLVNVARTCGASSWQIFTQVCVPSSLQMVFGGVRLALSTSWVTLVAAEMLASSSGLGYMIQMGRMLARPDLIILGMLLIGVIGFLISLVLAALERRMAAWRALR